MRAVHRVGALLDTHRDVKWPDAWWRAAACRRISGDVTTAEVSRAEILGKVKRERCVCGETRGRHRSSWLTLRHCVISYPHSHTRSQGLASFLVPPAFSLFLFLSHTVPGQSFLQPSAPTHCNCYQTKHPHCMRTVKRMVLPTQQPGIWFCLDVL